MYLYFNSNTSCHPPALVPWEYLDVVCVAVAVAVQEILPSNCHGGYYYYYIINLLCWYLDTTDDS